MHTDTPYRLAEGVQVRSEAFGLLFYNYRGPRLYFLPSRRMIDPEFFDSRQSVAELATAMGRRHSRPREQIGHWLAALFLKLEQKGLIHGQPLC